MKRSLVASIGGMHCVSCASAIESSLRRKPGVASVAVNYAAAKAYVTFDDELCSAADILGLIRSAGYQAVLYGDRRDEEALRDRETRSLQKRFTVAAVLSALLMFVAMGQHVGLPPAADQRLINVFQLLLASGVLACGSTFFIRGAVSILSFRRAGMELLVALGVGSAYFYSVFVTAASLSGFSSPAPDVYFETAALLLTFILLGKYLESLTRRRASDAMKRLMLLRPPTALVTRNGTETEIPVDQVAVGDVVSVKPGARLPVDGTVLKGYSSVDESLITGESVPVEVSAGSRVIGGTINKGGHFTYRATHTGAGGALGQIIELVETAQVSKSPVQALADRVAAYFVPAVMLIAFLTAGAWLFAGQGLPFALKIFISVLIVACPCSLGLAVPTAIMAGTGKAAESGIIVKHAAALQEASSVAIVVFDKTGTLTQGRPRFAEAVGYGVQKDVVLALAAALEAKSEHPLAEAVCAAAAERRLGLPAVEAFQAFPGRGIRGVSGGREVILGNTAMMRERGIGIESAAADLARFGHYGMTVMLLALDQRLAGLIAVRDTVKSSAQSAIDSLKRAGKQVMLLSGDSKNTADAIADELGIEHVLAELLPQDKIQALAKLQRKGLKVAFVGDGLNDAPALAQADVGIALGSGTDVASAAADIILIKDDVRDVAAAIDISRYTMRKVRQNLFWAFVYNCLSIPVAAGILYPLSGFLLSPVIAGAAMAFSSVSVVCNSLLMRRYQYPKGGE